jgi:NAD(P)-dependent dehydrogenase (short-subunit alcohol dehydrogenase family)
LTVRLDGEIAVVTGVNRGIGRAIAQTLADAGARVAACHHAAEVCARVAEELGEGHAGIVMDMRSRASIERTAEEVVAALGIPTILVNNAGINRIVPAESMSEDDWRDVLEVNLTGAFNACQVFGRLMLEAGRGSIVNIGSLIGAEVGMPGRAPYGASKAALVGLSRVLAVEWGGRGVRVNTLEPGPTRTPMVEQAIDDGIIDKDAVLGRIPAGRFATPEDVARGVLLLVAPEAAFVTGQTLIVDGGYVAYGAAGPLTRPEAD